MSVVARNLRRFARALQAVPAGDVLAKAYDRWSHLLVVRDHGKGAPSYMEGEAAAVHAASVDTTVLPDSPNTTAPTGVLDLQPFGGATFYWKNDTATHDTVSVAVWARADTGDWLLVATLLTVASLTEVTIDGLGYRQVYLQITATTGGGAGTVILRAAGA